MSGGKAVARRLVGRRWMAAAVLIAVTIGVGAMLADQRFLVPQQDPGGPFYARIEYGLIHHTDEWAAVAFYRERGCVPAAFNLLNFFDLTEAFPAGPPRPFLCPLTVHGFVVYEDMAPGAPPIQSKLQGNGAVTVIFVPWEALEAATSDNELFLPELLALPHVTGIATFFEETLHPAGGARQVMLELNAFGLLEDGRSFDYQVTEVKGDLVHVRIVFK